MAWRSPKLSDPASAGLGPALLKTRTAEFFKRSDGILVQVIVSRDKQVLQDAIDNTAAKLSMEMRAF